MIPRVFFLIALLFSPAVQTAGTPPVWTKPHQFWFVRSVPGGHMWLNVDAQHGVKEPLFDHQRLAVELTIRTGVEYQPLTLPFRDPAVEFVVKYDGSNAYIQEGAMAIEFILDGQSWRCDLQTKWNWNKVPPTDYECLSRGPAAAQRPATPLAAAAVVSPDGRWEAFVQDHNVHIRPAGSTAGKPNALSKDGTATNAYQPGSLRWSADSSKLSACRVHADVWLSESVNDTVTDKVKLVTHEVMKR